jgi:hypothetical protein
MILIPLNNYLKYAHDLLYNLRKLFNRIRISPCSEKQNTLIFLSMMESQIQKLLDVPFDSRNNQWEEAFLTYLVQTKVTVLNPEPLTGPDSWPYLHVRIEKESTEPTLRILDWLSQQGLGLLVDHSHDQDYPDAVLSWGMVWQLVKTGSVKFTSQPYESTEITKEDSPLHTEEFSWSQVKRCGDPKEDFLPRLVRKIIKEFLSEQEVSQPKILVYTLDEKNFTLAFSLESLGNPPASEHSGVLEALSWFLPPSYSLVLLSEKNSPTFFLL